jgi:hypothetical protein
MINKIIWKIRKKGGKIGINYFLLILSQFLQIGGIIFLLFYSYLCANWNKISPNNRHLIAKFFIFIVFLPLFGNCGNKGPDL